MKQLIWKKLFKTSIKQEGWYWFLTEGHAEVYELLSDKKDFYLFDRGRPLTLDDFIHGDFKPTHFAGPIPEPLMPTKKHA